MHYMACMSPDQASPQQLSVSSNRWAGCPSFLCKQLALKVKSRLKTGKTSLLLLVIFISWTTHTSKLARRYTHVHRCLCANTLSAHTHMTMYMVPTRTHTRKPHTHTNWDPRKRTRAACAGPLGLDLWLGGQAGPVSDCNQNPEPRALHGALLWL